jgi:hypothetical protein
MWLFPKGERIFRRLCGKGVGAVRVAKDPDIERLREHFRARDLFDRRETSSFGESSLDRLREELNEFGGPQYEALYRRWRERGDCVLGDSPHSPGNPSGGFATYRLDDDYELFGATPEETGMKEMRNIADRGGKHHDPGNGPRGAWAHRLEE